MTPYCEHVYTFQSVSIRLGVTCCAEPMIDSRGYPAGTYTDERGNVVTRMVTEWRCINCGARGSQ